MHKVIFGTPQAKVFQKEKQEKEKKLSMIHRNLSMNKMLTEDDDQNF